MCSNAYRWGSEEGIGGFAILRNIMFSSAFGRKDPILKERLFGLTNNQGNHGEDVKELFLKFQHQHIPTINTSGQIPLKMSFPYRT
jgi:hypothetical protein